ncbi:MAG: right-handed parallel beta-helix repeat-containing protein, partial [Lentisphaeria bacterium]|nr:right-handed parallel beta-helix repeat-containing protein [Lentisphaeria bacterium]
AVMARMNGWSDYNAYAGKVPAGEKNSFAAKAELGKNFTFKNAWRFDGRAIDSMPVGPYRRQPRNVQLILDKPEVQLSAPDMVIAKLSANIPFRGMLLWGDPAGGTAHTIQLTTESNSHAAALSGLKPGKKYFIQFKVQADVPKCFSNAELKDPKSFRKVNTAKIGFTAPVTNSAPQQYFVAKDGDDSNDGSEGTPFGTIGYAVTKLRPGDTLTIRGGTYEENFSVPVSGTKERPVVIRGASGEKVCIQAGYGSPLVGGITVTNQNYIHFQDFCIYGNHTVPEGFAEYTIRAVNCRGLLFQRMVISGANHKLHAINCDDIRIEDCAFSYGHEGVFLANCKDMVIRNCTFAHAALMHLMIRDERGPATVENCIFVDAINKKGFIAVITITDIANLTERNNCFFNRMPFDQKPLIGWDRNGKKPAVQNVDRGNVYTGRRQQPYPAYQKDTNRGDTGSFAANPGLKVFPDFICKYKSLADWKKNNRKKENLSGKEAQILRDHPELLRDLKHFLPTNPEVVSRGCGPRLK